MPRQYSLPSRSSAVFGARNNNTFGSLGSVAETGGSFNTVWIGCGSSGADIGPFERDCSGYNFSALDRLEHNMAKFHGYLSSSVCVVGILLNIIVIVVLTRKVMRNPFNLILTCIALCDIGKLASYTYYAVYLYVLSEPSPEGGHSRLGILLILVHNVVSIVGHVIGTLFTVALAFFRFVAVYFPTDGPAWCSMRRARCCLVGIVVVSLLATMPNSLIYRMINCGADGTDSWWFELYDWVKELHIETLNMYIYGIFVKMTSSLLNCVFSGMLLYTLQQVRKRRKRLKSDQVRSREARSLRENTRTTVLLVAVVTSFTVTEFPQGCLNLAAAVDDCVFNTIYRQVGNVMDILVILNSATNFFWLYGMSSQFRDVFVQIFVPRFLAQTREEMKQKRREQRLQRQQLQQLLPCDPTNNGCNRDPISNANDDNDIATIDRDCHDSTAV